MNKLDLDQNIVTNAPKGDGVVVDSTQRYFDACGNHLNNEGVWSLLDDNPVGPRSLNDVKELVELRELVADQNQLLGVLTVALGLTFEQRKSLNKSVIDKALSMRDLKNQIKGISDAHVFVYDDTRHQENGGELSTLDLSNLYYQKLDNDLLKVSETEGQFNE